MNSTRAITVLALSLCVPACTDVPEPDGEGVVIAGDDDGDGIPDALIACDGNAFDADRFFEEVAHLASNALGGRDPGTEGDALTRAFIEQRFRCLGLAPAFDDSYEQPFVMSTGARTANVVAVLPGSDPTVSSEVIVVGAHHDHLGIEDLFTVFNGANDNASGTVATLAVAQALVALPQAPRRTIVFALFGGEEEGLEGSFFFVDNAPDALPIEQVTTMINLDMVGTHELSNGIEAMGTVEGTPGRAVLDELLPNHPELTVRLGDVASDDSDHHPFCAVDVPYVYFAAGYFDEDEANCYHQACDDAALLDYAGMAGISTLVSELALRLADSPDDLLATRAELGCSSL